MLVTCNSHERNSREHNRTLSNSMDGDILGAELLEKLIELILNSGGKNSAQIGDVSLAVVEVLQ